MNLKLLAAMLAATAISGTAYAQTAKPAATSSDKPEYGRFGFDEAGMNKAVQPGDNFYQYANGTWEKTTPIPADKSNFGAFNVLDDRARAQTRGILEDAARDPKSRIGIAFTTYLDTAAIDAKGIAPIKPWLDRVKAITKADYAAALAEANRNGVHGPIGIGVAQDDKQPELYAVFVSQSGLGMPDRDYYIGTDANLVAAKAAYQAHIARMFTLAGEGDADARAKAIVDFETAIAQVSWTNTQNRDAKAIYNKMTVADLAKMAPGFDFAGYLAANKMAADTLIVSQPSAVAGIAKIVANAPIGVLRDQLLLRSLDTFADVLPSAFDKETFAFYSTTLSGTPEQEARWKRAVDYTVGAMDDEVGKIYVARYFPPEAKAAADALVANIIAAMGARIDTLTWMSAETKAKAHEKLAAFTPKIGYPSQWKDYSGLVVTPGDAFGNNLRANQWAHDYNVSHLGKPLQRWEWQMTPMTINAYANPGMVEIVFPAAILQPPFFDPKADAAVNYGGIGAVIGHELSHHFDDQGAKYDKTGALTDWWSAQDVKNFEALTGKLAEQYDAYEPLPGKHLNGNLTLGENMADLAGLAVAHDAYIKSLNGKPAPVIDGYTADQRFYLGWAQVWRRSYREANLQQRLLTDPHSPSEQRASIVRNMDAWYPAFQAKPGQKLYLTPEQRVKVW